MADDGQQRSVVVGACGSASDVDLAQVTARVRLNARDVAATGLGSAVLDDPLNSIKWLAGKLGEYGRSLRAPATSS